MTEKRFIDDGFEAIEDQSFTDNLTKKTYYVEYFDEVVDLCNCLWEQTKRFEKHNKDLMEENEVLKDKYNEQSVEYEGLEEQIERLLDFKDKVFNLINKKLKEADKGFEQTYDSWYQGQVDALKELKKELQE